FGINQSCQGLVAFGGQEQALQVATKCFALVALVEQFVEVFAVGFQWLRCMGDLFSLRHLTFLLSTLFYHTFSPLNKLPLQQCLEGLNRYASPTPHLRCNAAC